MLLNAGGEGTRFVLTANCVEPSIMGNADMLVKSHEERNAVGPIRCMTGARNSTSFLRRHGCTAW